MKKRFIASINEALVEIEKPNRFILVNPSCYNSDPVLVDDYTKTNIHLTWDVLSELTRMGLVTLEFNRKSPSRRYHMDWMKRSDLIM